MTAARKRRIASGASRNHHGRADVHRRVEAGQRRELAGAGRLVDGEQRPGESRDGCRTGRAAAAARGELDADRDVVAGVGAEPGRRWPDDGLRRTPGCSVITSPSSHDIRAISSSMCRRKAVHSRGRGLARQRGARRCARPRRRAPAVRSGVRRGCGRPTTAPRLDEVPAALLERRQVPGVVAGVGVRRRRRAGSGRAASPAGPARGSGRAGRWGSPARTTSGRPPAPRAPPGRRRGRRWWRAPRCRTARTARAAGSSVPSGWPATWS